MLIKVPQHWQLPEREAVPESVFLNRRSFLKQLGFVGMGAWGMASGCFSGSAAGGENEVRRTLPAPQPPYPAARNEKYKSDRAITEETVAAAHNNFYEFTTNKSEVWRLAEKFETRPWQIEIGGLVRNKRTYDIDELVKKFPLEERVYRFRCVEAWSMTVPWVGFPFLKLINEVQPASEAKFVRMITFLRPEQAAGQRNQPWYSWPYYEGLALYEAMNELTMLVTGSYGHALPKQHGAPLRLITPWKYGYKSIKSIVRIEFVKSQPKTFWNDLAPSEYDFWSNVNPAVPHPRWSQASETVIGSMQRVPTLPYNGYGDFVAHMYS